MMDKFKLRYLLLAVASVLIIACVGIVIYAGQSEEDNVQAQELLGAPDHADVTYCTMDGIALKLDLYLPKGQTTDPLPVAVYVHGGSFTGGDKRKGSGATDIRPVVDRGYAVASVNYRLAPDYKFPGPLQDVKCAIRFLRANASRYNLDSNRFAIWGTSAGGYLSAFVGLTGSPSEFDKGEYLDQSSSVLATADLFGPTDLAASDLNPLQILLLYRAFGSISRDDPFLKTASPINYISKGAPPFLIMHGDKDSVVPLTQSTLLHTRLSAAGIPSTLVIVKNANHEFKPDGGAISPSREELTRTLVDFIDKHLSGSSLISK